LLTPGRNLAIWLGAHAGRAALWLVTATSVAAVLLIFLFVIREAWPFFSTHSLWESLRSTRWYPEDAAHPEFGFLSMILGTVYVTAGALLLAVPAGLMTAVLLSDIVPFRVRQAVKPVIEILAAIPSVAYGFFAVLVLAPWLQKHLGLTTGTNILNSSIMLAVMVVPTVVSVGEDSLSAVGRELREASYALGATRAETLLTVVVPAAHNGLLAAVILGMMRAVGETMLVWMASGNAAQIPAPWWNVTQSVRTLTATVAGEMGETVNASDHYRALFVVGLMLLAFCFLMNLAGEALLHRLRRREGGRP
jgi:phosphate transport system permease protein